ncbi:unnamed protein product [Closterium sp. NIES-65]|nr:unnamed protein product [Closterium sp. NIES-65]
MATPSVLVFDAEGRAVDFEVWVDDLQHFLQCNRKDGLSLIDLTSGASVAPAADADSTVRSQWATRDAVAHLAVRSHLPSTERAHFSQYKCAKTLDHFLSVCPTTLTVDLLEGRLLAAEKSIVAVGASRGDPRAPFFEGCSPSTLLPSVASAAAVDFVGTESRGGGTGPCAYVLRTGDHTGEPCGGPHTTQRYFGRLTDAWRLQFPDATEIPRWGELLRSGVAIFDLDYDAILAAMYVVSTNDEGDCYLCVPPDPGIEAAALGAGEAAALGAGEAAALGASV